MDIPDTHIAAQIGNVIGFLFGLFAGMCFRRVWKGRGEMKNALIGILIAILFVAAVIPAAAIVIRYGRWVFNFFGL